MPLQLLHGWEEAKHLESRKSSRLNVAAHKFLKRSAHHHATDAASSYYISAPNSQLDPLLFISIPLRIPFQPQKYQISNQEIQKHVYLSIFLGKHLI